MQLTKLRAAPVLQAEVPPCAPAGETDGGTASQLIRSVRLTCSRGLEHARIGAGNMLKRARDYRLYSRTMMPLVAVYSAGYVIGHVVYFVSGNLGLMSG